MSEFYEDLNKWKIPSNKLIKICNSINSMINYFEDLKDILARKERRMDIIKEERDEIDRVFPAMNRGLTGYNLKQLYDASGHFHLEKLLCGSEGSLALVGASTTFMSTKEEATALASWSPAASPSCQVYISNPSR